MSRTDVHRPYWVQLLDPTIRSWSEEDHDHRTGPCDLEQFYKDPEAKFGTYCCCRTSTSLMPNICGCRLCTWHFGRHYSHKQERQAWTQARRALLKDPSMEEADLRRLSQHWG